MLKEDLKRWTEALVVSGGTLHTEGLEEDVQHLFRSKEDGTVEVHTWIAEMSYDPSQGWQNPAGRTDWTEKTATMQQGRFWKMFGLSAGRCGCAKCIHQKYYVATITFIHVCEHCKSFQVQDFLWRVSADTIVEFSCTRTPQDPHARTPGHVDACPPELVDSRTSVRPDAQTRGRRDAQTPGHLDARTLWTQTGRLDAWICRSTSRIHPGWLSLANGIRVCCKTCVGVHIRDTIFTARNHRTFFSGESSEQHRYSAASCVRAVGRADLAAFLRLFRRAVGPVAVDANNRGIIDGFFLVPKRRVLICGF